MKALLIIALLYAAPALAQSELRPEDANRLDGYTTAAGNALLQALSGGAPEDVAALTRALSGTPQVAFDETLAGDWNCRTLKLGGISALVVYTPFKCRFSIGSQGFDFEKLTGSQRTKGTILLRDGRAIYAGVGFVAGQTPPAYGDLPADFVSNGSVQTQVAVFERISESQARLLFPAPAVESDFDILELTR
ncbi:MAG: DUF4893 domain-containing protein [Sulfitobacter sp.]